MPAATGKRKLLDVMCRYADHIARTVRAPDRARLRGYCGHEEIELALVKLARVTGETRYHGAGALLHRRARPAAALSSTARRGRAAATRLPVSRIYEYNQSHVPVREQDKVVGHAVRAMYLYSGDGRYRQPNMAMPT